MDSLHNRKLFARNIHGDSIRLLTNWRDFFWAAYYDEKVKYPHRAKIYKEAAIHYDNALAILELNIEAPSMDGLVPVKFGD